RRCLCCLRRGPLPTVVYTLSLHDALPILGAQNVSHGIGEIVDVGGVESRHSDATGVEDINPMALAQRQQLFPREPAIGEHAVLADEVVGVVDGQLGVQLLMHAPPDVSPALPHYSDFVQPLRISLSVVQHTGDNMDAVTWGARVNTAHDGLQLPQHEVGFGLRSADNGQTAATLTVDR